MFCVSFNRSNFLNFRHGSIHLISYVVAGVGLRLCSYHEPGWYRVPLSWMSELVQDSRGDDVSDHGAHVSYY